MAAAAVSTAGREEGGWGRRSFSAPEQILSLRNVLGIRIRFDVWFAERLEALDRGLQVPTS